METVLWAKVKVPPPAQTVWLSGEALLPPPQPANGIRTSRTTTKDQAQPSRYDAWWLTNTLCMNTFLL